MDRGFAPETPVKGGITLDEPGFAIRTDCDGLNRQRSGRVGAQADAPGSEGIL